MRTQVLDVVSPILCAGALKQTRPLQPAQVFGAWGEQRRPGEVGGQTPQCRVGTDLAAPRRSSGPVDRDELTHGVGFGCDPARVRLEPVERSGRVGEDNLRVGADAADPVTHGCGRPASQCGDGPIAVPVAGGQQSCSDGLDGVKAVRVGDQTRQDVASSTAAAPVPDGDDTINGESVLEPRRPTPDQSNSTANNIGHRHQGAIEVRTSPCSTSVSPSPSRVLIQRGAQHEGIQAHQRAGQTYNRFMDAAFESTVLEDGSWLVLLRPATRPTRSALHDRSKPDDTDRPQFLGLADFLAEAAAAGVVGNLTFASFLATARLTGQRLGVTAQPMQAREVSGAVRQFLISNGHAEDSIRIIEVEPIRADGWIVNGELDGASFEARVDPGGVLMHLKLRR